MYPDPVEPNAKEQAQRDSWQEIMALSTQISTLVESHSWTLLIDLADQRDVKVAAFLAQSIPGAMYTQVMLDIDQLKQQHALISSELARQQQHAQAKQRQLGQVKDELVNAKAGADKGVEVANPQNLEKRH
jgi:hypothetical protein